jgi:aspartyl/asparaginyl-tRNA synthetase
MHDYVDGFRYAAPPHAGGGIGAFGVYGFFHRGGFD